MIVKNEKKVIQRCLESTKRLIDYWVIVDTGSTDGTQDIIREVMKGIPGELYERPWVNFGHNRNEALGFAKGKGDYVLFIDADEEFFYSDNFSKAELTQDLYYISCDYTGTSYVRKLLINSRLDWKWEGVVHELITCKEAKTDAILQGVVNKIRMEGSRSLDPDKYKKDAEMLEAALKDDPSNARNVFNLAQSYRDAKDYEKSLLNYQRRVAMGGGGEEIFWSLYQIGMLQEALNKDFDTVIKGYSSAFQCRAYRAEPLYQLARYLAYEKKNALLGYLLSKFSLSIPMATEEHALENWIYSYGMGHLFYICAYELKQFHECCQICEAIAGTPAAPLELRQQALNSLKELKERSETKF
jgi:glycosyltransferase involved in cell wall biosynthesis